MTVLALQRSIRDIVEEYEQKTLMINQALSDFEKAGSALKEAACVAGTWGNVSIDTGSVYDSTIAASLLKSAWRHVYDGLQIDLIASASDKRRFQQELEKPIPFTLENIRATFGAYISDPRGNILRGLAEVFGDLDPAFKSHDKVKIGVTGLPKRIIISNVGGYGSWGRDKLANVINALAQYQGKPLVTHREMESLLKDGDCLRSAGKILSTRYYEEAETVGRGIWLKRFANGNGHLFFDPDTLRDINRALAEYYGEVLPDCSEEKPEHKRTGTAVSKDLQYYPTPQSVVDSIVSDLYGLPGQKVLEPSCGCGRFLDALRKAGASVLGVEVDAGRVAQCREKGHNVLMANFLETVPTGDFDRVVMNPPFYGKHYAKHVDHAMKFLKPGGTLTAILPITARYDHGLVTGRWHDLPVGSFKESGTNINTTVLTKFAEK